MTIPTTIPINRSGRRPRSRREAGAALIEFVILVPFLTLLLLGLVETGRYAYFAVVVGNAVKAGLQYGSQNGATALDSAGISSAVSADGANTLAALVATSATTCECWNGTSSTATSCSPTPVCTFGHPVEYLTVTATGNAHALFDYYLLPSTLRVTASATQRIVEQ